MSEPLIYKSRDCQYEDVLGNVHVGANPKLESFLSNPDGVIRQAVHEGLVKAAKERAV